jgi:hypothetical protein
MPLWGNDDSKAVSGTIAVTQNSTTVTGTSTSFTTQLAPGQTLVIASVEYKINSIASNTSLELLRPYAATNASGLTVTANEQPAYIPEADLNKVFGISVAESQNTTNRNKGIHIPGWVSYTTYTDSGSNTRHKAETLVAFSAIAGDGDSTTFPDVPVITISEQPANISRVAPATAAFSVTASATNSGVLSYQWQKQEAADTTTWTDIPSATSASYTTPATNVVNDNGDKYRVVVSATLGAVSVTSNAATLTVTAV